MSVSSKARRQGEAEVLDAVFSAVADATRRSMLDRLRGGELTVSQLAEPYAMSLNAVSKHIKTLERAGLVRREIRGREHSCRLHAERFADATKWMNYYTEFWSERMDALEEHLIAKRKRGGA